MLNKCRQLAIKQETGTNLGSGLEDESQNKVESWINIHNSCAGAPQFPTETTGL